MTGIEIVQGGRATGKTHRIIEWLRANPGAVLVCSTEAEAARLRREYDLDSSRVLGPEAHRQLQGFGGFRNKVAIDNLDDWLRTMFGDVEIVSLTVPAKVTTLSPEEPTSTLERIIHWANEIKDNDGRLTADSSMSLDMALDELEKAARDWLDGR